MTIDKEFVELWKIIQNIKNTDYYSFTGITGKSHISSYHSAAIGKAAKFSIIIIE